MSSDGRSILLAGLSQGTSQITVTAAASNSAGTGRDTKTFTLTVSNKSSGGGGGCSAGFSGLVLLAAGFWVLRRRG